MERRIAGRKCDLPCPQTGATLEAPPERFMVDGQYTPRKQRLGKNIQITGFNSLGHFIRGGPAPIQSSLAVNNQNEFSPVFVLENFLRILMAYHVLDQGGVLLHSAGVLYQDRVYLFCGQSNAGKTTLRERQPLPVPGC